jgi:hypothetical protein
MQEYKYTYQDWQEENIIPKDLDSLRSKGELSIDDYNRIRDEQRITAIEVFDSLLDDNIRYFLTLYSKTQVKVSFLEYYKSVLQKEIDEIKFRYPNEYREVLWGFDGRYDYTYHDIAYINYTLEQRKSTFKATDEFESYVDQKILVKNFYRFKHIAPVYSEVDKISLAGALRFMEWLVWFKESEVKESSIKNDLYHKSASLETKKEPSQGKNKVKFITWVELFKDSKQADKILQLVKEHLSHEGQWETFPKSRYLVALCIELEKKGYFKNGSTTTNPMKAIAFRIQFGSISPKNFQPEERNRAEAFREYFKHIPPYKPEL